MEIVKVSILSVLISLSGWMRDGLKSYEAKKYDDAIKSFTKVIEKDIPQNRYRDVALFYRARSYEAKKDKKKAIADLLVLILKYPDSYLVKDSTALYKKLGGDMKKILPANSPKEVWAQFIAFVKAGDADSALAISTGMWKEMITGMSKRPGRLQKFGNEDIVVGDETIGKGKEKGTATLELGAEGRPITMHFVLDPKTKKWLIKGPDEMGIARSQARSISNMNNLKQIGLGLIMYSNDYNEKFPPNLNTLKTEGYLQVDSVYYWSNPNDLKEKVPFIYCPGLKESDSVDCMIAAAPKVANGKREVLWLDGHVKTITEEEFIKNARKQKWRIKGTVKKEEVPEKVKEKVLKFIKKLGDKDFDIRKKAKAELIKMGDSAIPFLEENKNHQDPEIKVTIKDILEGK